MVGNFMRLGNERIAARYCHLFPQVSQKRPFIFHSFTFALLASFFQVKENDLLQILNETPKLFKWAGLSFCFYSSILFSYLGSFLSFYPFPCRL
jgi:hypothetical protein